jgi:hypothetical protein
MYWGKDSNESTGNEGGLGARKLCRNKKGDKRKCGREKLAKRRRKKRNVLKEGRADINK